MGDVVPVDAMQDDCGFLYIALGLSTICNLFSCNVGILLLPHSWPLYDLHGARLAMLGAVEAFA